MAEPFCGYWWAFRVLQSISWVLLGISCFAEHFVGIVGHFVFGRGFSWVLMGFSCLAEHFVGIGGLFVFGKQASPGNIMFDTPKHSAERVFW